MENHPSPMLGGLSNVVEREIVEVANRAEKKQGWMNRSWQDWWNCYSHLMTPNQRRWMTD